MTLVLEIHLAAPGSRTLPGRTFPVAAFDRITAALEAQAGVTVTHALHNVAGASAEWFVELATWDRDTVRDLGRRLFRNTPFRGSIAGHDEDGLFFESASSGGSSPSRWKVRRPPVVRTVDEGADPR